MALFDPREDERLPTFANGPLFGTLPHSRVIVFVPNAAGVALFMRDGIVIEYSHSTSEGPDDWNYTWKGVATVDGNDWQCSYNWDGMDQATGLCHQNLTIESSTGGGFANWTTPVILPKIALPVVMDLNAEAPSGRFGDPAQKIDVVEWSDVASRWPNAHAFPKAE